jgi:hypothetical protein
MDEYSKIMHLRLAFVGGFVIFAFGLVSLLGYHHLPILSFTVGPLISLTAWRVLQGFQPRKSFVEIRLSSARPRRRKF